MLEGSSRSITLGGNITTSGSFITTGSDISINALAEVMEKISHLMVILI